MGLLWAVALAGRAQTAPAPDAPAVTPPAPVVAPPGPDPVGEVAAARLERHGRLTQDAYAAIAGAAVLSFGGVFSGITAYSAAESLAAGEDVPWLLFGIGGVAGAVGACTLLATGIDAALVYALDLHGARPLRFLAPAPPPLETAGDPAARKARRDDAEIKRWVLFATGLAGAGVSAAAGAGLLFVVLGTESLGDSGPAQTGVAAAGTLLLSGAVLLAGSAVLAPLVLRSEDDIVQAVLDERAPASASE